ncbi:hypothetical protein [Tsukamurella paurometabola]|uniref:Uncharacterized protein n=1 Tax=Tsukamurella paurometabola TaxID=2061 RepID=A0ABS5NDX2_TSUPA|nr:hypothetical protein [Tsukamurella paurometabola]MBS4102464.1 hypothetical protein [Tsukamurella paurometabola]
MKGYVLELSWDNADHCNAIRKIILERLRENDEPGMGPQAKALGYVAVLFEERRLELEGLL